MAQRPAVSKGLLGSRDRLSKPNTPLASRYPSREFLNHPLSNATTSNAISTAQSREHLTEYNTPIASNFHSRENLTAIGGTRENNKNTTSHISTRANSSEYIKRITHPKLSLSEVNQNHGTSENQFMKDNLNNDNNIMAISSNTNMPIVNRNEICQPWYGSHGNLSDTDSQVSELTMDSRQVTSDLSPSGETVDVSGLNFDSNGNNNTCLYRMPIVGYEVLEERSRFTIFKIQIIHQPTGNVFYLS